MFLGLFSDAKISKRNGLTKLFPGRCTNRERTVRTVSEEGFSYTIRRFRTLAGERLANVSRKRYLCISEIQPMEILVISKGTEMLCVPVDRLVYISSDGNYSTVVTQDNREQTVSYQLGQIEDLIDEQLGDAGV